MRAAPMPGSNVHSAGVEVDGAIANVAIAIRHSAPAVT
jgi:hypothetical protein